MKQSGLLPFALAMFIMAALPSAAFACSCARTPSISDAFAEAHSVVAAEVVASGPATSAWNRAGMWFRGLWAEAAGRDDIKRFIKEWQIDIAGGLAVTLRITESFKGLPVGPATIYTASTEASCGFRLEVSQRYLVYLTPIRDPAEPARPYLVTHTCLRTALLASSKDEVELLRELKGRAQ